MSLSTTKVKQNIQYMFYHLNYIDINPNHYQYPYLTWRLFYPTLRDRGTPPWAACGELQEREEVLQQHSAMGVL